MKGEERRPTSTARPKGALTVRRGSATDATFIRELGGEAFGEYSSTAGGDALSMASRASTLVVEHDGRRAGLVIVEPSENGEAHLAAIAVVEAFRGQGIGRALLRAAEGLARQHAARTLSLTTAESNLAALELFLRSGFQRAAHGRGRYPRGQRMVRLEKRL